MRLLSDENFNGAILRGLIRRLPKLDVVRVQDVGLRQTDDATILEWAANEDRILLTHDVTGKLGIKPRPSRTPFSLINRPDMLFICGKLIVAVKRKIKSEVGKRGLSLVSGTLVAKILNLAK